MSIDAWVIGVDNLPPELLSYANALYEGMVVVREHNGPKAKVTVYTQARFREEFQWL